MTDIAEPSSPGLTARESLWSELIRKEDWRAIWIGLGLIAVAVGLFLDGGSLKWIAVAPQKWIRLTEATAQLRGHACQYVSLLALWAVLFGIGARGLGIAPARFLAAFVLVYLVAVVLYFVGQWGQASHYNLEPPLVALGLVVSNTVGVPAWFDAGLRVEFYVKTGIVLLGLDRRLAAVLGTGGALCGVAGSIAVAGAIGARKEHVSIGISLVVLWAIVMIFALPLVSRSLGLATGVARAWIGTSEFADAAALAAARPTATTQATCRVSRAAPMRRSTPSR